MKIHLKNALLWVQRFTRLDMIYIARGGFWMTFGHVVGIVFSALVTIAAAYFLPKETYGVYKYALSLFGIINILTLSGLPMALTRAVARGQDTNLKGAFKFMLRWSVFYIAAANAVAAYYWLHGNRAIGGSLFVLAFLYPLIQSLNAYGAYLTGKKDFKLTSLLESLSSIITSGSLIAAIALTGNTVVLVLAYAAASVLANAVGYWLTVRKYPQSTAGELEPEIKSYGTSLSLLGALGAVSQQLDKIFIFKYTGAVELATYAVASAMPDRLKSYIKNISWLAFPKLSERDTDYIQRSMRKRIFQSFLLGAAASGIYIALAPFAFQLLLPKYMESVRYSQLLSLMTVFLAPSYYISYAIQAQQLTRAVYAINIFSIVSRIVLLLAFGYVWGPLGVVWSRITAMALVFFAHLAIWNREMKRIKTAA